jgi:hypothetical protein
LEELPVLKVLGVLLFLGVEGVLLARVGPPEGKTLKAFFNAMNFS